MKNREFANLQKPAETYINVIKSMLPVRKIPVLGDKVAKYIGAKPKVTSKTLPDVTYTVSRLSIDMDHLNKYNQVCGFKDNGLLPPTYLCVLSQTLQMNMMTQEAFPFPMLGLVHITNSITQHRPIAPYETIELSCAFGELKPHDKGQQFDFITTAKVMNELVYEAKTTYLVRGKTDAKKKPSDKVAKPVPQTEDIHGIWRVPENIGRIYAPISGDFNLIHIHKISAKAFGFKTAIAHGMWSKARSLAELGDLPDAYTIDVTFKLPIFLPAQVELIGKSEVSKGRGKAKDKKTIAFTLYDAKSDKPHLAGSLKTI